MAAISKRNRNRYTKRITFKTHATKRAKTINSSKTHTFTVYDVKTVKNGEIRVDKRIGKEGDGWIRITIRGAPYDRGFAHGQLAAHLFPHVFNVMSFLCKEGFGRDIDFFY
jgi:hypothetical protein